MKYLKFTPIIIISSFILSSCIHDEDNCPNGSVTIAVADKNYSNVQEIKEAVALNEDLPMLSYVNSLDLLWNNLCLNTTGETPIALNSNEKMHMLDLKGFAKGKYNLFIASGNLVANETIDKTTHKIELHPNNTEYMDIYAGQGKTSVPMRTSEIIALHRLKGKVLIIFDELPTEVANIEVLAENVSKTVLENLKYEGSTTANKSFVKGNYIGEFLLAPSVAPNKTLLTLHFKDAAMSTIAALSNVGIYIDRNKLSVIKPSYDPETDKWEINLFVEGEWEQISYLEIKL